MQAHIMRRFKNIPPQTLKIYPVIPIPHKIRKLRAIIDLSLKLLLNGFKILSVNDATRHTAKKN